MNVTSATLNTTQPTAPAPSICLNRSAAITARNRRVESYRELVRPLALHYARCSAEALDDLVQVGLMGLIRAAELYRNDRGVPFAAFARPHIRGAILHYLRDAAPVVRLPRRQAELRGRLRRLCQDMGAAGGTQAEGRLRQRLGVDEAGWQELQRWQALARPLPLSEADLNSLAAPEAEPATVLGGGSGVRRLLAGLDPRQRQVVEKVVLAGWSYRRLGRELQVSPMTVQRLLHRGLEQLRTELEKARFSPGRRHRPVPSAAPAC